MIRIPAINSSGGGASPSPSPSSETFLKQCGYSDDRASDNSYIDLSPADPTALKSNNCDIYCSFVLPQVGIDPIMSPVQDIFYIEKVCGISLDEGMLKSWNWGDSSNDTVISSVNGGERYDLKCEIRNDGENITKKWYRKNGGEWTAITDAEFTDNGIDPTDTQPIHFFCSGSSSAKPFKGMIIWESLKIDINGQPAFDATTATRESGEGNCYVVHGLLEKTAPF